MIISVKWLQDYVDIDMPIDKLATLIGARLVEIEETIDYGAKFKDVVIAKVVHCSPLEGSDHLNVTKLDDGGARHGVERDEAGLIQVVCGAPNVREGMTIAWLPPDSIVPETHGTNEPFTLSARKLRGVMSNGMIASARELALSDEHEGILDLGDYLEPGASFVDFLHLDDTLLDIENKSLTHRPDAFGVIGFAREIAGIQGRQFETPPWLKMAESTQFDGGTFGFPEPKVTIDDPELSDRYLGIIVTGVDGKMQAPLTQQTYLTRVGVRPISAIVDMTNFLMLETGQPLHAFDYDKLAAVNNGQIDIHVRAGRDGETLALLDGRTIALTSGDIVIANGETAVALAGAMGGAMTEVDQDTKTIFLESATFNLYNLRATQMRHGIFSEAITRFTKGQPSELTAPVLALGVKLLGGLMDAQPASRIAEAYPGKKDPIVIELAAEKVNGVLGTHLTADEIARTLRNVEFEVDIQDALRVTVPYWRNDIHIPEDIIEEVGRLGGFDSIRPTLPARDFSAVAPSAFDELRSRIRAILARAGGNEVLTYSFVHGNLLEKTEQKRDDSYQITNSISPDLQYYRQSITPSLLSHVHGNIKQGHDAFSLFELNKVHPKQHGLTDEGVPKEVDMLGLVVADKKPSAGAPYYHAKRVLDFMASQLGLELVYTPIESEPNFPVTAPFDYHRSALVADKKTGTFLGIVGEYKTVVKKALKLPEYSAGFELGTRDIFEAVHQLKPDYAPLSRFPGTERDICFQVNRDVRYDQITYAANEALGKEPLTASVEPLDIYQSELGSSKNVTIRVKLVSHERTLTGDDVSMVIARVIEAVKARVDARVI